MEELKEAIINNIKKPAPMWAVWLFRIVFFSTTATTIVIAGDQDINDKKKVKVFLYLKGFDVFVWGIARGIGVDKKLFQNDEI